MAKLNAKKRNALPDSVFAGPDRSFPVNDPSHARNALARVANRSSELKAKVRAKVHKKFPDIGKMDGGRSTARLDRKPRYDGGGC